jgi:DNA-binding transcriptional LysR family regulator
VSQRIRFIEDEFGHQLIDRSGPALALTPAGQVVLAKARELLGKERELTDCLKGLSGQQRLHLCCTPTFGLASLPQVISSFMRKHSEITDLKFIFLQADEAVQAVRTEQFDLAVIEHCPGLDFRGLDCYGLPEDELCFVTAPGNLPDFREGCVNLEELKRFRLLTRSDGCSAREILCQVLQARGGDLSVFGNVMITDDLQFAIKSVMAGQGVAFLSKALVSSQLETGELVAFTLCGTPQRRGRSVLLHSGRQRDPLVRDLLESVFQVAAPGERPQLVAGVPTA